VAARLRAQKIGQRLEVDVHQTSEAVAPPSMT
jgi:hypothetical protein